MCVCVCVCVCVGVCVWVCVYVCGEERQDAIGNCFLPILQMSKTAFAVPYQHESTCKNRNIADYTQLPLII